jgi:hypothetical protein
MPRVLKSADVVGRQIAAVLQGRLLVTPGDYSAYSGYVRLDDGTVFELIWTGVPECDLVAIADETSQGLSPAEVRGDESGSVGDIIVNVLRSLSWPTIGLLLASNRLLFMSDVFSMRHVRVCLSPIGEVYSMDEVVPFWGGRLADELEPAT